MIVTNGKTIKPEYFFTVLDFDNKEEEQELYRRYKIGFLLDDGFVLKNAPKTASHEIEDYQEFDKKQKMLEKKAFSDLAEIFDDLSW